MGVDRQPHLARRRVLDAFAVGLGIAFVILAVLAHRTPYFTFDVAVTRAVQSVDSPWFIEPLALLSALGFPPLVDFIAAGIILVVLVSGARWSALCAAFAAIGIAGLNFAVKGLVDRPRPSPGLVHVVHHIHDSGFPAGHVMTFTAFFGFLGYLAWVGMRPSWRRTVLVALVLGTILLMGVARVDAGEHWPSDVIGGYLVGALWLMVTIRLHRWGIGRRARGSARGSIGIDVRRSGAPERSL